MSLINGMVSGVIGAIIFIIFLFILDIGMVVSILAGIISFAATLLIFHSLTSKRSNWKSNRFMMSIIKLS